MKAAVEKFDNRVIRMVEKGWVSRTKAIACGLSIFGLLAACTYQLASKPGELAGLPQREDGIENIKVQRDHSRGIPGLPGVGDSTTMYVTVNGKDVATLRAGGSVKFGLAEGQYTIGIRCSKSDGIFVKWKHKEISVQVGENPVDIFASYVGMGSLETCTLRI
jgi:hypothetical protein